MNQQVALEFEEEYEYLITNNEVYILRPENKNDGLVEITGNVKNEQFRGTANLEKIAIVDVAEVKIDDARTSSKHEVWFYNKILDEYSKKSGFNSASHWLDQIKDLIDFFRLSKFFVLYLYRIFDFEK